MKGLRASNAVWNRTKLGVVVVVVVMVKAEAELIKAASNETDANFMVKGGSGKIEKAKILANNVICNANNFDSDWGVQI